MIVLLSWLIAAPPLVALLVFATEILLGAAASGRRRLSGPMPSTLLLIPAHNEAATIGATLDRLRPILSDPALSAKVSLMVVADNCADDTARIVEAAGHRVVERFDAARRGKGFALAFGRDQLRFDSQECVIVFDADCETDADSIADLSRLCVSENRVVQARYVFRPDRAASPKVQISNFALWVKNVVRQRGLRRSGGGAVLVGTGMAFPWPVFAHLPLATDNIVEDLALGIHLTQARQSPVYLDQANVSSAAASEAATLGQRARWEHGFLSMAGTHGLPALWGGLIRGNRKLFRLGLHLLIPPLAFLILCSFGALGLVGGLALASGYWPAFAALAAGLATAVFVVGMVWAIEGHRWLSFAALLRLPFYFFWKIPVYLRFFRGDRAGWTRTERSGNETGS